MTEPNGEVRTGADSRGTDSASSAPESTSKVGDGEGARQGPTPCTCGFCDGVTVEVENVNLHTGETETESFERMSRRRKCPNCGGVNLQFRRSYVAHAAEVVDRVAGERNVYALHITLDTEAVRRAGIAPEETYKVWTDGGPWSRARDALQYRDGEFMWMGSLSARPSDGMYHLHLVVITRLSVANFAEALHATGLDAYVQTFDRSESAGSKEQFAAMWAAYAFDNAAHGASARATASERGYGEGYDSTEAKERRRGAVGHRSDPDEHAPARGPRRNHSKRDAETPGATDAETPDSGPDDGVSAPQNGDRAPPVVMEGGAYRDRESYFRAVKRTLMGRVGTAVHVHGMGAADLLRVTGGAEGLTCTVAPEVGRCTTKVRWTEIYVRSAPVLRRQRRPIRARTDTSAPTDPTGDDGNDGPGPAARYTEAARTSRVTVELADGRRHVTEKNHRTGRAREYLLPPRHR